MKHLAHQDGRTWRDGLDGIDCFVQEAVRACANRTCSFFVEADSVEKRDIAVDRLRKLHPNAKVAFFDAEMTHHDHSISLFKRSTSQKLKLFVPSYAGWEVLKHMNHLVISRSGFSETASWMSHIPTYAFHKSMRGCGVREYPEDENAFSLFGAPETSYRNLVQLDCAEAGEDYLDQHQDVKKAKSNPWLHYKSKGFEEGRSWPGKHCD